MSDLPPLTGSTLAPTGIRPQDCLPPVFLLSGSAGLVYEVVWTHQFANILGSTTESMAVVFSVFLAGLALGGFLFGRSRTVVRAPLAAYAWMELGIGVLGIAASLALVSWENELAVLVPKPEHLAGRIAVQVLLISAFLGPATLLMGGTLPVMMEATRRWFLPSRRITALYGINTAGAALGALLPGLALVPELGLSGTAWVAMAINTLVWALALALGAWDRRAIAPSPAAASDPEPEEECGPPSRIPPAGFVALAALSGVTVLSLEMCWGRLCRLILGNRTLATSVLLFGVLVFLGLGSLTWRRVARGLYRSRGWGADDVLVAALFASAVAQIASATLAAPLALASTLPEGLALVLLLAIMAPAFYSAGLFFPWLLAHHPAVDERTAHSVGHLYAWNVAGCTVGSLVTSFVAFEWLGTPLTLALNSAAFLALGVAIAAGRGMRPLRGAGTVAVALAWALAAWFGVPRHLFPVPHGEQAVAAVEDRYGIQVLSRDREGILTASNNKVRLVARYGEPNTIYAQHLQSDVPMLLARGTAKVLNIGTGYGITAGAFTLWQDRCPSLVSIEILPFMVEHQGLFAEGNYGFFRKAPQARLVLGDGRHWLVASDRKYDIISVNPLDAQLPGSSTLCTVDFWKTARDRLEPGGIYCHLVWGGQTKVLMQGFATVFPDFQVFRAYGASWVLVGGAGEGPLPEFRFERLTEEVRAVYRKFGIERLEEYFGILREVARHDTEEWVKEIRRNPEPHLHSNDRPILEFSQRHGASAFRTPDEVW